MPAAGKCASFLFVDESRDAPQYAEGCREVLSSSDFRKHASGWASLANMISFFSNL